MFYCRVNKYILSIIACIVALGLTACHEQSTASVQYLLTHPAVLLKESDRCLSQTMLSTTEIEYCATVVKTAVDHMQRYFTILERSPEQFGEQILLLEMRYVEARQAFEQAKQIVHTLRAQSVSAQQLRVAENALQQTSQHYHALRNEVRVLLAIAGLQSPE